MRYGIATGASAIVLMWAGRFIDRFDLRVWATGVVLALAGACLLMSWTPDPTVLVFSLFAMRFAAQGEVAFFPLGDLERFAYDVVEIIVLFISHCGVVIGSEIRNAFRIV